MSAYKNKANSSGKEQTSHAHTDKKSAAKAKLTHSKAAANKAEKERAAERRALDQTLEAASELPVPEYELESYEPVEFSMSPFELDEEDIKKKMLELANAYGAVFKDASDHDMLTPSDTVSLAVHIERDGRAIASLCTKNRLYAMNKGLMPPDFDNHIFGMKLGEVRSFDFMAPDIDNPVHGSEHLFHAKVTLNRILEKLPIELSDAWVNAHLPMYKDLADFHKQVADTLKEEGTRLFEQDRDARAVAALSERFAGHIEDAYYEEAQDHIRSMYQQQASSSGLGMSEFLTQQGFDQNTFNMMILMQAREMLVGGFVLDAWARHYHIEPTEDEVKDFLRAITPSHRLEIVMDAYDNDPAKRDSFILCTRRALANKDLVKGAIIHYKKDADGPGADNAL